MYENIGIQVFLSVNFLGRRCSNFLIEKFDYAKKGAFRSEVQDWSLGKSQFEEMPLSPPNRNPNPILPLEKKRGQSLTDQWFEDQQAFKDAIIKIRRQSLSNSTTPPSEFDKTLTPDHDTHLLPELTSLLSDELLFEILSRLPESQHISNSLVCKRWAKLSGRLVRSIKLLDWEFLESGRLVCRFCNLNEIDIVRCSVKSPRNSGILLTHKLVSVHLDAIPRGVGFVSIENLVDSDSINRGIKILTDGCSNLRKLVLIGASEEGLSCLAKECHTLQELELHCCTDLALKGIAGCQNLQILKLIACVDGLYDSVITDIGLTILAQGCTRLVKLELVRCEGSYDGIKAIGQCCQMLEELIFCDHRMDCGWLSALSYCMNLKTLRLQSCRTIDSSPGPDEYLGSCPTLEELHVRGCQMRDKQGARALFLVCGLVREILFEDCWGLDNNIFVSTIACRNVRFLSVQGCSLLTVEGLESVVLSWNELERLRVDSCNNMKNGEITPELAALFSVLKELKWRPDSRSLLSLGLAGTGVGQRGGRSFKIK